VSLWELFYYLKSTPKHESLVRRFRSMAFFYYIILRRERSDGLCVPQEVSLPDQIFVTLTGLDKKSFGKEGKKINLRAFYSLSPSLFSFIPSVSFWSLEVNIDQKTQLLFLLIVNGAKKGKTYANSYKKGKTFFSCRGIDTTWRPIHNGTTV